jgi:RNA polymerase II subunit A C-terminal domain phosphatase
VLDKRLKGDNNNVNLASVPMVHSEPGLKVSEKEAHEIGRKHLISLVKNKKLVLLVDLDHTVIHTTNDNVSNTLKVTIFSINIILQ